MTDPREILEDFYRRWSRAYTERAVESMASLYDSEALFFGSTPELLVGRDGVKGYFEALAPQPHPNVEFELLRATAPLPGVVEGASLATFTWTGNAGTRVRFTHSLVLRGETWLASAHHASPHT